MCLLTPYTRICSLQQVMLGLERGLPTVTTPHGTTGYEIATGICIDVNTCVHVWFAHRDYAPWIRNSDWYMYTCIYKCTCMVCPL